MSPVQGLGISVKPSELKLAASTTKPTVKTLTIKNPGQEAGIFEVYVDDFYDWIRVEPKNFVLASKGQQVVTIFLSPTEAGVYNTDISITTRSLASESFRPTSGLKVPLTLTAKTSAATSSINYQKLFIDLGLVVLLGVILWKAMAHRIFRNGR